MRPRDGGRRHTIDECMDLRKCLVVFVFKGGIIVQDRHGGRSRGALEVLVQSAWVVEDRRRKDDCLFAICWMILTDHGLCEHFMCRAAIATPTMNNR